MSYWLKAHDVATYDPALKASEYNVNAFKDVPGGKVNILEGPLQLRT
jgi:hypothetical protein